jgi:hypothetical protein
MYAFPCNFFGVDFIDELSRGGFTENFGDDFLGLRELGIADEFGLSSLSIPKRLWTGKGKGETKLSSSMYVFRCRYRILTNGSCAVSIQPSHHHLSPRRHHSSHLRRQKWKTRLVYSNLTISNGSLRFLPLHPLYHHCRHLHYPQMQPNRRFPYRPPARRQLRMPMPFLSYYQTTCLICCMSRWGRLAKLLEAPRRRRRQRRKPRGKKWETGRVRCRHLLGTRSLLQRRRRPRLGREVRRRGRWGKCYRP